MTVVCDNNPWKNYRYFTHYFPCTIYPYEKRIFHKREEDNVTIIMGFYVENGIILASDSMQVCGDGTFDDKSMKIHKINNDVAVVIAGEKQRNLSILQDFEWHLQTYKNQNFPNKIAFKQALNMSVTLYVRRMSYSDSPHLKPAFGLDIILGGHLENDFVIYAIGYTPETGIYEYFYDITRDKGNIFSIGGSFHIIEKIRDYFKEIYLKELPVNATIPIIKNGILHFSEKNCFIGGEPQIAKITSNGFEWVEKPEWITE
jgi:20S proteasome alpha/beta subunit